jgi:hypothetical protein
MPRPKPTLHFALVEGEPHFEVKDWTKIESAYGSDLTEPVRNQINHVTWLYLLFAQHEQAAVPASDVANLISSVRRDAEQVQAALLKSGQLHHGAAVAVIESVNGPPLKIDAVANLMSSLIHRCELAETELKNSTLPGHVVGEAWDRWVRDLATILSKHGLPAVAGKNWDGPGVHTISEFTALVIALQDCLPDIYGRPFHSGPAITKAIHRALTPLRDEGGHVSSNTV